MPMYTNSKGSFTVNAVQPTTHRLGHALENRDLDVHVWEVRHKRLGVLGPFAVGTIRC